MHLSFFFALMKQNESKNYTILDLKPAICLIILFENWRIPRLLLYLSFLSISPHVDFNISVILFLLHSFNVFDKSSYNKPNIWSIFYIVCYFSCHYGYVSRKMKCFFSSFQMFYCFYLWCLLVLLNSIKIWKNLINIIA